MSGLQSPTTLQALKTRVRKDFQSAMQETETYSDPLYTKLSSGVKTETYAWLAAQPHMRKWIGARQVDGLKERVYQITNEDYEKTTAVKENDIEDGMIADKLMALQGLGIAARKLPDDLATPLLKNGHLATATGYDGQNFFDTDHPDDIDNVTGTQSNYLTGTALTDANFATARAQMRSYVGENGFPISVNPSHLYVPPALETTALTIAKASFIATGGTNVQAGIVQVVVVPELAGDDTTWYLFDLKSPGPKPLILQERQAPRQIDKTAPTDDNRFWNKEYLWGVDARYGAGYGVWFKGLKAVA